LHDLADPIAKAVPAGKLKESEKAAFLSNFERISWGGPAAAPLTPRGAVKYFHIAIYL